MKFDLLTIAVMMSIGALVHAGDGEGRSSYPGDFETGKPTQETEVELPSAPNVATLRPIYVSAVATNNYFIDEATLTLGTDRVVRYVLVVETAGGARNVSFEGMRCEDGMWKLYAIGHADGSWVRPRSSKWYVIENKPVNRHHAALSRDYFCPNGGVLLSAEEGRNALREGKHPKNEVR